MTGTHCRLIGAPMQDGAGRAGCEMGPSALRCAGIGAALDGLGHRVSDMGDLAPAPSQRPLHPNPRVKALAEVAGWVEALSEAVWEASADAIPIVLGGDHALSAGTLPGMARRAEALGRPLFVLWLDAHADFHTLESTQSGNLHGVPLAYATGQPGFAGYFPPLVAPVDPARVCLFGTRSLDPAERNAIARTCLRVHDMRAIDELGIAPLLRRFLEAVRAAGGILHVSLDVDFLDPAIAPAVGTTVPGGASFREAHLVMEMLCDAGIVASLDLVELNPFLDERGRTAHLMVDLASSLFGRRILDRPKQSRP